jgi:hypothetical protein
MAGVSSASASAASEPRILNFISIVSSTLVRCWLEVTDGLPFWHGDRAAALRGYRQWAGPTFSFEA